MLQVFTHNTSFFIKWHLKSKILKIRISSKKKKRISFGDDKIREGILIWGNNSSNIQGSFDEITLPPMKFYLFSEKFIFIALTSQMHCLSLDQCCVNPVDPVCQHAVCPADHSSPEMQSLSLEAIEVCIGQRHIASLDLEHFVFFHDVLI